MNVLQGIERPETLITINGDSDGHAAFNSKALRRIHEQRALERFAKAYVLPISSGEARIRRTIITGGTLELKPAYNPKVAEINAVFDEPNPASKAHYYVYENGQVTVLYINPADVTRQNRWGKGIDARIRILNQNNQQIPVLTFNELLQIPLLSTSPSSSVDWHRTLHPFHAEAARRHHQGH